MLKRWIAAGVYAVCRRGFIWSQIAASQITPANRERARAFVVAAIDHVPDDLFEWLNNLKTERQIATARLARRYDPGMALSESFQRAAAQVEKGVLPQDRPSTPPSTDPAINAHYATMRAKPVELSPNQQAALKVQEKTLRRNLTTSSGASGIVEERSDHDGAGNMGHFAEPTVRMHSMLPPMKGKDE